MLSSYRFHPLLRSPRRTAYAVVCLLVSSALLGLSGCGSSHSPSPGRTEKIVFTSIDEGFAGINTINPDGTGRKLIFAGDGKHKFDGAATFSPDGSKILFLSDHENCGGMGCEPTAGSPDYRFQIWIINADGTELRQVTRSNVAKFFPQFLPDGSQVLYTTFENETGVLHVIDLDGSNDTILLRRKGLTSVALSPDGAKILFSATRSESSDAYNTDIYLMNRDGTSETRLTNSPVREGDCAFSPDGHRIMFSRFYPTNDAVGTSVLWIMNVDGTGQTQLTTGSSDDHATFSPDGKQIVFQSSRDTGDGLADPMLTRIFVMNADGTNPHPIPQRSSFSTYFDSVASHNVWARTTAP